MPPDAARRSSKQCHEEPQGSAVAITSGSLKFEFESDCTLTCAVCKIGPAVIDGPQQRIEQTCRRHVEGLLGGHRASRREWSKSASRLRAARGTAILVIARRLFVPLR